MYIYGTGQEEKMIVADARPLNHTYAASLDTVHRDMNPVHNRLSGTFTWDSSESWPFDFPNKSVMFMGETKHPPPIGIPHAPSEYTEYDYSQIEYKPVII